MRTTAVLITCLAVAIWLFIMKNGNANTFRSNDSAIQITEGGNPTKGHELIETVGCTGCHDIPGASSAHGHIGPPLTDFRERAMIAGVMANSVENLEVWLQDPRKVDAKTAMPNLGLSREQARDIAAYLYSPN